MPGVAVHASLRRAALAFVVVSALAQAIDPDAGHARPLLEGDFTNPSWSPAGNELAVLHGGVLEVANADGTGLHELLVPPTGGETHPAWSPDGNRCSARSRSSASRTSASRRS